LPKNRVPADALLQAGDKALFRLGPISCQEKRKPVQTHHVFSEDPLEVLAGCVFGCTFTGTLLVFTAKHQKKSPYLVYVRGKRANGFICFQWFSWFI
jgi:hypothetical protein